MTAAATRFDGLDLAYFARVASRAELRALGIGPHDIAAQVQARRWQLIGTAVVLHNAAPSAAEWRRICVLTCGPRAVLTSFTATEEWGLRGWERDEVHVLAPAGTRHPMLPRLVLHRTGD